MTTTRNADRPNLFDEARGELAQDAFLAWLLNWAAPRYQDADPALHRCAQRLLRHLGLAGDDPIEDIAATCQTGRGRDRPDVVVRVRAVGTWQAAIIEHKIFAPTDPKQLDRYHRATTDLTGLPRDRVRHVFIKTGLLTRDERANVGEDWLVLDLDEVLDLLAGCETRSDIFADYRARLLGIQGRIRQWKTSAPEAFPHPASLEWQGLFEALSGQLGDELGSWVGHGVLSPPTGSFAAMWWGWRTVGDHQLYLQAHSAEGRGPRVAVKCQVPGGKERVPSEVLRLWRDRVAASAEFEWTKLSSGKHVAVGYALGPWWSVASDGGVDVLRTARRLVDLTGALDRVTATHG